MTTTARNYLYDIYAAVLAAALMSSSCLAEDGWNVEGEHGEMHLYGALLEGSCRLGMRSEFQEVVMDSTPLGGLQKVGDMGKPALFSLRLLGCQRSGGKQTDRVQGTVLKDSVQPVITISFGGVLDPDNPTLLRMKGISGVGLMIRDTNGQQIRPGERGKPQYLTPGGNQLRYTVMPVRTRAPLIGGHFRTVVDFKVSYD